MALDDESDEELVRQFRSGTPGAFDAIVRRFEDRIFRLAAVSLYDAQYAADVTQEVLIRSHKGLRRFRFGAAPFTWIYRTTRLVCVEFNRRRVAERLHDEPVDTSNQPDALVADLERAVRVRALVAGLPERQREVVLLRVFEDLSVRETAAAMGCREGTVKALLHKANANLETALSQSGIDV